MAKVQLRTLANNIINEDLGICVFTGEVSRDIDLFRISIDDLENDILTFVVKKSRNDGFFYFFTKEGFEKALNEHEFIYNSKKVWIADEFHEFSSISADYLQWGSQFNPSNFEWLGLSDPRKIVRDLSISSDYSVPHDIRPWLLRPNQNTIDSNVFRSWRSIAAKNISLTLPSEVRCSGNEEKVAFRGEKNRDVNIARVTNQEYLAMFSVLHECADWTFSNIQDAEIKHTLLNYHLASEWTDENLWPNKIFLERALSSARESYKLHLQGSGRELLKAYVEIKKSIQDDVNKVADNTRGLVANFWRDFAIAATVLVLNFITKSNNLSPEGIKILYTSTSIFLILSLIITTSINARFNQIAQNNRNIWRERLYPFVDDKNFNELVTIPISKGITTYHWVVLVTYFIYLIMSAYLICLAY